MYDIQYIVIRTDNRT